MCARTSVIVRAYLGCRKKPIYNQLFNDRFTIRHDDEDAHAEKISALAKIRAELM